MANYITVIIVLMYLTLASVLTTLIAGALPAADIGIPNPAETITFDQTSQNFTTTCDNITLGSMYQDEGEWVCNSTYGIMSNTSGLNRIFAPTDATSESTVNNTYTIANPDTREFKVFLAWGSLIGDYALELRVEDDRFVVCYAKWGICWGVEGEHLYAASALTELTITTSYNWDSGDIVVSIPESGTFIVENYEGGDFNNATYYSGLEVIGENLGWKAFDSEIRTVTAKFDITNPFSFFWYLVSLIAWFPPGWLDEWWMLLLNVVLFKIPGIALVVAVISMIKGE